MRARFAKFFLFFSLPSLLFLLISIRQSKAAVPPAVLLNVPFTSQAPLGKWDDLRQEDGCEEASSLMAVAWARHETFTPKQAEQKIIDISNYEQKTYGSFADASAADTVARIIKGYFKYQNATATPIKSASQIIGEIKKGNLVIAPVNGQKLKNPNYKRPGPLRHMLLIKGYDFAAGQFIANDAGTRKGNNYRYPAAILENALRDYVTGNNKPITQNKKVIIIVRPAF